MSRWDQLRLEPYDDVEELVCQCCGQDYFVVDADVLLGDQQLAYCRSSCYHHEGVHEVYCDVFFSPTWDPSVRDRTVMTCRIGPEGATAMDGLETWAELPTVAHVLTREEALAHPQLQDLWDVIDCVVTKDDRVATHLQHQPSADDPSMHSARPGSAVMRLLSRRRRGPSRRR